MKCAENIEHLAAYLHDELTSADEDSFQLHLSVCAACREKHTATRDVMRRLQRVVPLEPSAASREDLRRTIDTALRKPDWHGPPVRFRDGSEVRWRRPFAPKPFALSLRKPPALPPPPPDSSSASLSAVQSGDNSLSALSPSARAVSTRLNNITRRRRKKRIRRGFLVALGVACLVGVASYAYLGRTSPRAPVAVSKFSREEGLARSRWNERHAINERHPVYGMQNVSVETFLIKKQAELGEMIGDSPVRVLPHCDPRCGETCLVLYTAEDVQNIAADERFNSAGFEKALAQSVEVIPVAGSIALPPAWVDSCIGQEARVVVLRLENRLEIWSVTRIGSYLTSGPTYDKSAPFPTAASNGLPVLK